MQTYQWAERRCLPTSNELKSNQVKLNTVSPNPIEKPIVRFQIFGICFEKNQNLQANQMEASFSRYSFRRKTIGTKNASRLRSPITQ